MWITRHSLNNSLVVFVHGIFGSRWQTWKTIPQILQEDMRYSPLIRSYDIYLFDYKTRGRQPEFDPYIIDELRGFLDSVSNTYDTVVFVAHSQGGILCKLFVLEELKNGKGKELKVDLIITLGTPHRGRRILNPILWGQNIPWIGRIFPFRQLGQLGSLSNNVQTLRTNWNDSYVSPTLIAPEPNRKYIRSIAAHGAFDRLVTRRSAQGYRVDIPRPVTATHGAMARPTSPEDATARVILKELRELLKPSSVLQEIVYIREDSARRAEFIANHRNLVQGQLGSHLPGLDPEEYSAWADGIICEFLWRFPQRPLRAIEGIHANLREFVRRWMKGLC